MIKHILYQKININNKNRTMFSTILFMVAEGRRGGSQEGCLRWRSPMATQQAFMWLAKWLSSPGSFFSFTSL
jgi:hypothetical protein